MQSGLSAVQSLSETFDVVVIGHQCQSVADQASTTLGAKQIWLMDQPLFDGLPTEAVSKAMAWLIQDKGYDRVFMLSDSLGKACLPTIAMMFDVSPVTDIAEIIDTNTFKRPIYAGNAIETVRLQANKHFLSFRAASFKKTDNQQKSSSPIESLVCPELACRSRFIESKPSLSDRPDLSSASKVVSGGRGLGSLENFHWIEKLATCLQAAVGASRAAVDAGYIGNDSQVGQTGKIIAPDVYFAIGISGAIQHLAGMKDSKVVVAINKDADAPIFQYADYGLVGDLFEIIPNLIDAIEARKSQT